MVLNELNLNVPNSYTHFGFWLDTLYITLKLLFWLKIRLIVYIKEQPLNYIHVFISFPRRNVWSCFFFNETRFCCNCVWKSTHFHKSSKFFYRKVCLNQTKSIKKHMFRSSKSLHKNYKVDWKSISSFK